MLFTEAMIQNMNIFLVWIVGGAIMPSLNFQCPHCSKSYNINTDNTTSTIRCPDCGQLSDISRPNPPATRRCPFCSENILSDAKKCRYCGEFLDVELQVQAEKAELDKMRNASQKSRGVYIILGIFFGLLGIHNFYAGRYRQGITQILVTLLIGWLILPEIIVVVWIIGELITIKIDGKGIPMSA